MSDACGRIVSARERTIGPACVNQVWEVDT
jgi:hypothetical protein